jgi:hypothetical protein
MNKTLLKVYRARQAILATTLLTFSLVLPGCNSRPLPGTFNAPPLDAYALSGGKIKHFQGMPFLPADPAAKAMLLACRQLPIHTDKARSAILVVTAGQFGKSPLHAMVAGNRILMLPGDFITMGMDHGLSYYKVFAPNYTTGNITLIPGSEMALVGHKKIFLHDPVLSVITKDLVMNWTDMTDLLRERDRQCHQSPFIRNVQIIYDIKDYRR